MRANGLWSQLESSVNPSPAVIKVASLGHVTKLGAFVFLSVKCGPELRPQLVAAEMKSGV